MTVQVYSRWSERGQTADRETGKQANIQTEFMKRFILF